ncbi:MAG TPA: PaaI family thioesterase [Caulobacteraceae bacterium]|jgi:uncharacterized protein (TIGR00369 family)
MANWTIKLGADELNDVMNDAFPGPNRIQLVKEVSPGRVRLSSPFNPNMLRPGGLISGQVLMSVADTVGYVIVMAHVGPELMAVTSNLTMNFLRGCKPGEIQATGELLSLGRRNAVCDVRIWTESPERIAAQATVTYARALPAAA